jgi:hypothetical protein
LARQPPQHLASRNYARCGLKKKEEEGGEQNMILTYRVTKVIVHHVHSIRIKDNTTNDPMEYSEKVIRITTTKGDEVELLLQSESAESLKFEDWDYIKPQVYKGSEE